MMAALAELELELGRERRAASRHSRRGHNLPATKPAKLAPERQEQLRRLAATGEPVRELAKAFGIGRATAYRYMTVKDEAVSSDTGVGRVLRQFGG
jgi:DNA invertase Pin-like site-specific DNA recombinase